MPQAGGINIEAPEHAGAYHVAFIHEGWPVLQNGAGIFCFRQGIHWALKNKHDPVSLDA